MASISTLWKLFPMIYLIGGMFYNYYQFTRFVVRKFRRENIFIYFVILVATDSLVLVTPLIHEWLKMTVNMDVRSLTKGGCRLHSWLSGVALDVPPWILVLMAYEKRALLWFPVPADSQFTRHTAKLVMAGLVFLAMFRHLHLLWGPLHNFIVIADLEHNGTRTTTSSTSLVAAAAATTTTTSGSATTTVSSAVTEALAKSAFEYHNVVSSTAVCNIVFNDSFGIFMTLYNPWIDLLLRVLAPCLCLAAYNATVVRKIMQEKYCAQRLMEKVGIMPPAWFFHGVIQMESTVKRTSLVTLLICVCSVPHSVYLIMQPAFFDGKVHMSPTFWLTSNLLVYLNYSFLFPTLAALDHALLVVMRDTWRLPMAFAIKRGTKTASMPPRILPERSAVSSQSYHSGTVGGVLQKVYLKVLTDDQ